MNTQNLHSQKFPRSMAAFMIVLVLVTIALIAASWQAKAVSPVHTLGGDCSADRATGDLYILNDNPLVNRPDEYCLTGETAEPTVTHPTHGTKDDVVKPVTEIVQEAGDQDDAPVVVDNPVVVDDPVVNPQPEVKSNHGNHYGNDKPDQNERDVKNPHNGENTYADHHDEPKKEHKTK